MTSSPTAHAAGLKRPHEPDVPTPETNPVSPSQRGSTGSATSTSNFRNVSACNRCRLRKNRCDQRLPACTACEKASHRCVGFDPITRQEIPRSYVYYLESRLSYFESLLVANNIAFEPADAFDDGATRGTEVTASARVVPSSKSTAVAKPLATSKERKEDGEKKKEAERLNKMVDDIGMVSVHGASDRRYLGSTSGISFARVVLAAVKSSVNNTSSERTGPKPSQPPTANASQNLSMRDSYFGLSTKPTIKEAPFPNRSLGDKLVRLYFQHANPQMPILHREEFMMMMDHAYKLDPQDRTPKQLYLLNIVFAIGAGVIFGSSDTPADSNGDPSISSPKRVRLSGMPQAQPEEYHASAIVHLSSFLSASSATDGREKAGGDLDDLQAVLLLAGFALLRPVAPGLWYIVGVAMRLAIDLGLHFEDGLGLNDHHQVSASTEHQRRPSVVLNSMERGKREWTRDLRRRLWWCTYSFDRMVSTCVGRPFGITDVIVTTEFPSPLDDRYITQAGILKPISDHEPSYKLVAFHYVRLRLLQSEILQVLQYQEAQQARHRGVNRYNNFVHKDAPSPFLVKHPDFVAWRTDMDQRLYEWKQSAPTDSQTGVTFPVQFLELNYWQAVITLYRNSLSTPDELANVKSPTEEVSTPTSPLTEVTEDQDVVFLKCAEAGQKTLKIYRQLHRRRLVNYTYLATHHLFMAGISFLYAVWHSPSVRRKLTLDDFDFTVLAATSVLGDLMVKCPPAEACRDAFERMSKATVQMCMSTPGFGFGHQEQSPAYPFPDISPSAIPMSLDAKVEQESYQSGQQTPLNRRPPPTFDMDLRDLFPDDLDNSIRPSKSISQSTIIAQRNKLANTTYNGRGHNITGRPPSHLTQQSSMNRDAITNPSDDFSHNRQQRQMSQMISPHPASLSPPAYVDIHQNTYNADFMSNLPGLDFLNSLTRSSANNDKFGGNPMRGVQLSPQPGGDNGSMGQAFDSSMSDSIMDYGGYEFDPAFQFGDNVGFDFNQQHDWGNGQNGFDLFGGFFFDRNGS